MNSASTDSFRPFVTQNIRRATTLRNHPVSEAVESGYDAIIQEASALLKDGPLNGAHVLRLWSSVSWNKIEEQRVATDTEVCRDGSDRINLYPSLVQKPRKYAAYAVLREFGHLLYAKASDQIKRRWIYKLGLPSTGQITAIQGRLDPQFKSYRDLVESFTTAMDRYVALNVSNALIANGVRYSQSQNIQLKEWGPTQEYCNRRRYHVLIPLVSAYSSKEIYEDFGSAFADWTCGMCGITESSVADATHDIIKEMTEALR